MDRDEELIGVFKWFLRMTTIAFAVMVMESLVHIYWMGHSL